VVKNVKNLNKILEEKVQDIPRLLLRRAIGNKVREQGIDDEKLIEAIVEHVLSGSEETFHYDDGTPDEQRNIKIEFTDADTQELEAKFKEFIDNKLPEVIQGVVRDSSTSLSKALKKRWPEQKIEERNDMQHFRDRIDLRWAKTLDPLRMLLIASREVGQEFVEKLSKSRAKKGIVKREALVALHMRACQTTMEILVLLENGLADGAYARWRTLYELSVVAFVIDRFGDDVAERYLAHDVVSMRESIINEYRYDGLAYDPESLTGEEKEIEEEFQFLISEFGKSFGGAYGWAANSLDKKAPRFQDLEAAIDWNSLSPNYKWSSYKVHAGVAGTVRSLGSFRGQPILHAGASNAGLETPAINTAYSLMQITLLVFGKLTDLENQIKLQSLVQLREEVRSEGYKAARKLDKDEMEIRLGVSED